MKLLVTKEGKAAFAVGIVLILSVLLVNRNPADKKNVSLLLPLVINYVIRYNRKLIKDGDCYGNNSTQI